MEESAAVQMLQQQYSQVNDRMRENSARIVIMGATGVGKTSVMNAAFGCTVGEVGHALPCTQDVGIFAPTDDCPVWVYDTKGFEPLSDNQDIFQSLENLKAERLDAASVHPIDSAQHHAERLHAVWWVTDHRFEQALAAQVERVFGDEFPIFIVINKCDKKNSEVDEVIREVKALCPWAAAVVPVVATPKNGPLRKLCETCGQGRIRFDEEEGVYDCRNELCTKYKQDQPLKPHYGIDDLLAETVQCLPELVAVSFYHAQRDRLASLDSRANAAIATFTAAALAIGANPMPFSDFPLLMGNEVLMFTSLAAVYELKVDAPVIDHIMGGFAGLSVGAFAGLALGSFLKMIPGVGTALGGATDAAIAVTVTFAIGQVVKELLRRVRSLAVCGDITADHFYQVMKVEDQKQLFREALDEARRRHHLR